MIFGCIVFNFGGDGSIVGQGYINDGVVGNFVLLLQNFLNFVNV